MKIKTIKKTKTKYEIEFEDGTKINTYDEVIIKNNILYKKELEKEMIQNIENQNKFYETYYETLKFIKKKIRSEYEIIEFLKEKECKDKEKIIQKLKDQKLINDKLYTRAYIHDKISFSQEGPEKIKKHLINNKIKEEIIEEELNKIDKQEINKKLEKLIIKKLNSNTKYSNKMITQKLINYFTTLGYEKNDILYIINNNIEEDNEIIKKEYNKLIKKLERKYSDNELKQKIKQKLFQKGFSFEEINDLIN